MCWANNVGASYLQHHAYDKGEGSLFSYGYDAYLEPAEHPIPPTPTLPRCRTTRSLLALLQSGCSQTLLPPYHMYIGIFCPARTGEPLSRAEERVNGSPREVHHRGVKTSSRQYGVGACTASTACLPYEIKTLTNITGP